MAAGRALPVLPGRPPFEPRDLKRAAAILYFFGDMLLATARRDA